MCLTVATNLICKFFTVPFEFKALCYMWLIPAIAGNLFDQTILLEDQQHKANSGGFADCENLAMLPRLTF